MEPYKKLNPGVFRNINKRPRLDSIPGIAPDDHIMESIKTRPRHRVRTNMYAIIEKRMGLITAVLLASTSVLRRACRRSRSLKRYIQWRRLNTGSRWKKPDRTMKLPTTRLNEGTTIERHSTSTINPRAAYLKAPMSISPGTFKVATGATVLAIGLLSLIAYILVRTSFRARALLDFLSWFPQALPGLLLGLGMLWLFLTPALQFLYGTIYVLIFATVISSMTLGVQIIKANLIQLGAEMEEASIVAGASWLFTMRKVVLPLIAPILAVVGTLNFISAAKDVSNLVLLTTAENRTLAILQLDLLAVGDSPSALERGTVISVIMVLISTGVALISRAFGMRLGIR